MKVDLERDPEMKAEYDFSKGIRGAYTQSFREPNLVSLDADLRNLFPDSAAVNSGLRRLIELEHSGLPLRKVG